MSDTARLVLFGVVVGIGAVLAALKVISGDAWLTLAMGLLLPSPLEGRRGGPPLVPGAPSGPGVASVAGLEGMDLLTRAVVVAVITYIAGLIQFLGWSPTS